jgi:hypothetical protein
MSSQPFRLDELAGADESIAPTDQADALAVARTIEAAMSGDQLRPDPGPSFTDRVMVAVLAAPTPHRRRVGNGTLLLAAAIALGSVGGLVVAGGLGLLDRSPAPSPEVAPSPSPLPTVSPSVSPSPSPMPSPSPSPGPSLAPSPTGTDEPTETETAEPTGTDDSGGSNSGPGGGGGGGSG